jgi:hypothetical protein
MHRDAMPAWSLLQSDAAANAIDYAKHHSRSHDAVILVYDAVGNVIQTHETKQPPRTMKRDG